MAKRPIGEFLAQLRRTCGFTQQEVADRLGISNRTLSAWEQGRSYPDILSLPALAEIYGVTADEILQGEYAHSAASVGEEISDGLSEDAKVNLYKSRLARVSTLHTVLAGVSIAGAVMLAIAALVSLFYIFWLTVLLLILFAADVLTFIVLVLFFDKKALFAAGIYAVERLDDGAVRFVFLLRKAECKTVRCGGVGYLVCAIAVALMCLADLNGLRLLMMSVSFAVAAGYIIAAAAVYRREIKLRGGETERYAHCFNRRLAGKCLLFCSLPVLASALLTTVFVFYDPSFKKEVYSGGIDDFKAYMHTLDTADIAGYSHLSDSVPRGSFLLEIPDNLSESYKNGERYFDVGSGFSLTVTDTDDGRVSSFNIYYDVTNGAAIYYVTDCNNLLLDGVDIFNVRYGGRQTSRESATDDLWGFGGECEYDYKAAVSGDRYTLYCMEIYDVSGIFLILLIAAACVSVTAGLAVYILKHKKVNILFEF